MTALSAFRATIWRHFEMYGRRNLPWRRTADPYRILIAEVMLQQTQVERVIPKYHAFIRRFPTLRTLSRARPKDVLRTWQGLGYNRRALFLKRLARIVMTQYGGKIPQDPRALASLPGIGKASAGGIAAFAFNKPTAFIETNIRRVFIYFFFPDRARVSDVNILPLVERTLDRKRPREWYWALMDYGAMLGKRLPKNPNVKSARYRRQPAFEGSHRQLRGRIVSLLLREAPLSISAISRRLARSPSRIARTLRELQNEGLVKRKGRKFTL